MAYLTLGIFSSGKFIFFRKDSAIFVPSSAWLMHSPLLSLVLAISCNHAAASIICKSIFFSFSAIFKEIIKQLYEDLGGDGFNDVERVHKLSMKITEKEKNIDLQIIDAAAWLHDIARTKESRGECICHAEEGTKMAESFLKKINFPEEKIPK